MKTSVLTVVSLLAGAFLSAGAAETPESVARAHHYPVRYCAVADTPSAQSNVVAACFRRDPKGETRIWPEGRVPFQVTNASLRVLSHELWSKNVVVTDVNDPFFTFFPAAGKGARPVVVVLPGGGYRQLGWNKEGTEIAEWLNRLGFSAALLLYRAPDQRLAALCDVQRTIGLLRRDAARYNIDPDSVGVIGFSAGANLAIAASTNWRRRAYPRVDDADDQPCRPDFQMPIYPWDLRQRIDPKTTRKGWTGFALRKEYPVDAETPPAFIVQSEDDFCEIETAVSYDYHLRAAGVPSRLRVYPNGGHGYGLRKLGHATDTWSDEAAGWLATYAKPSRRVLFLGDSITDAHHIGCTKNYWGFLADRFGFRPYVYGLNGQQMNAIPAQARKYHAEHPERDPDVIFVFMGTNDFNGSVPLGSWFTIADEKVVKNGREVMLKHRTPILDDTFRGRINRAMATLRELYPLARLVLLTPIHRGFAQFGPTNIQPDESYSNLRGLFIDDYVSVVKEAANLYAAKLVDLNASCGIYPNAPGQNAFLHNANTDRLHPSAAGHERMAEAIAEAVGAILVR